MPTNQGPIDTWELPPDSVAYQWVQELKQQGIEQGIQKGMELGIQKGMEQGIEQGVQKGMELGIEMSIQIIKLLWKEIALPEIAAQLSVSLPQVQRIAQKLAQAGVGTTREESRAE